MEKKINKNWKNHLLNSGLPFEYEVKECFVKYGCTVWDEYSYIKEDENKVEKEFSYDIDANYWENTSSLNFMIECKYKTEPTKWVFTPDAYAYQDDLNQNSFLHPLDHFTKKKFLFNKTPFHAVSESLAPFCLKGIEILNDKYVEINIFKAINQLSYAFIEKIISCMGSQLDEDIFKDSIFFNIPIIVTNADLYLINDKLTTKEIKAADSIDQISSKHDFLFFHNKTGEQLRIHNYSKLFQFFTKGNIDKFNNRNNSFSENIEHFIEVISRNYSPETILIMHHDEKHDNYKKLFDYLNFLVKPSKELDSKVKEVKESFEKRMKDLDEKIKNHKIPQQKTSNNKNIVEDQKKKQNMKENAAQNTTLEKQRFENYFFQLLNLHNQIIDKLYITKEVIKLPDYTPRLVTYAKREFFDGAMFSLEKELNTKGEFENPQESLTAIRDAYRTFNFEYSSHLSHYFRNLYHIYKSIHLSNVITHEEKESYASIVRAQLSNKELSLIFYNMLVDGLGYPKFKFLDQKYDVLKNMDFDSESIPDSHVEAFRFAEVAEDPFKNEKNIL